MQGRILDFLEWGRRIFEKISKNFIDRPFRLTKLKTLKRPRFDHIFGATGKNLTKNSQKLVSVSQKTKIFENFDDLFFRSTK